MQEFIQTYLNKLDVTAIIENILTKLLSLLFLFLIFYIAKKLLHTMVQRIVKPSLKMSRHDVGRQKTISRLLENVFNYTLYFFLLYCILSILGLPVSSLLAGAGIAGVAIGMGAQGFLSDVINGFFILFERQLDVGDEVVLTNGPITVSGKVVSVGIRTTQIRGFDGTLHFIPNRNITIVSNKSRGDMRAQIDIPVYPSTDINKVTSIIQEVNRENIENYPQICGAPNIIGLSTTPSGQLVFRIDIFTQNGQQTHIYADFLKLYQEALIKENIELPRFIGNPIAVK